MKEIKVNKSGNERNFREYLSNKISSTLVGLWFLVAEHLRLGSWDLLKGYTGGDDRDFSPRIAMQMVNEAALCQNRIRKKNYITHQGFELLNGLSFLASDEEAHALLNNLTVPRSQEFQTALSLVRKANGHYNGGIIAIDPHRIISTTKRVMPMKKKHPEEPAQKMLQTFFSIDVHTGQPIGFCIGSTGANTTKTTLGLLDMISTVGGCNSLVLADKEHFTQELIGTLSKSSQFELLVPAVVSQRILKVIKELKYQSHWAGYSIAETVFNFDNSRNKSRLIVQREGEVEREYKYMPFIALSDKPAVELITEHYQKRWSIEDFFNFDGAMGFDRASTFNLNIRYGKMSLALLAQAATYQLRQKLPKPYNRWNAVHLADVLFNSIDGDIRVKNDTILVTCYNVPKEFCLHNNYLNLPQKLEAAGVDPHVPWMYDFKLDFRFK